MNIFVANLDWNVTSEQLKEFFDPFGEVDSAKVIYDRETQRSRGFGFVEMANEEEGQAAIDSLNGSEVSGREMVVKKARPRGSF